MKFIPLSEEDLQRASLLEDGVYDYQVIASTEGVAKSSGNPKIDVKLRVWDKNGSERTIFTNMSLIKLLKHFCDVNNLQDAYLSGNVPAELLMNKSGGKVVIGFQAERDDGRGGMYPARNVVKDYVANVTHQKSVMKPLPEKNFHDDELPF